MKLTIHSQPVPRSTKLGAIQPPPPYAFMAKWLVKHRDITFYSKHRRFHPLPHQTTWQYESTGLPDILNEELRMGITSLISTYK
jgi:hypothetical protein